MRGDLKTGSPVLIASTGVKTFVAAAALSIVLSVGTGGVADPRAMRQRGTNFEAANDSIPRQAGLPEVGVHSIAVADSLTTIRSNFELRVVDLTAPLRVSRQTLYDWFAERQMPQPHNITRLRELELLSILWRADLGPNVMTVRRKFADKSALLDILCSDDLVSAKTREALRSLATARAGVLESGSITNLMTAHRFHAATQQRQSEAIEDAGR